MSMNEENMSVSGLFKSGISKIEGLSPLKVSDYYGKGLPNVGICLSGGGSRAMTAGMGQLRGLKALQNAAGSLLQQTKAISTVSGGSWVGVTFEYVNKPDCSDDDYLGKYAPPSEVTASTLSNLPENNIGYRCTKNFDMFALLWQVLKLWGKVPANMIWQTLVGQDILAYYGLFDVDNSYNPNSLFSSDPDTLKKDVTDLNKSLLNEKAYLIASGKSRVPRPYLICNMGMFVVTPGTDFRYLVPAQATPFFTGIISAPPNARDFNGKLVGGGTVTSFAFASDLNSVDSANMVTVNQSRQFALADAVGVSSAFFAEILENLASQYRENPGEFIKDLQKNGRQVDNDFKATFKLKAQKPNALDDLLDKIEKLGPVEKIIKDDNELKKVLSRVGIDLEKDVKELLGDITGLVPRYKYWPILNIEKNQDVKPTDFADAGNLENTGINGMLVYSDIDNIIAFINTSTPLGSAEYGIIDPGIPGTNVMVDSQIPPLFGYQPYDDGYKIYDKNQTDPDKMKDPVFRYNQVFPSESFAELLKGLWANCDKGGYFGSNFVQSLTTVDNPWFGVKGGKKVRVLWVYSGNFKKWYEQLTPGAQNVVSDIDNFPYYDTVSQTELSKEQVNALAGLTSWNVVEGCKDIILGMYK